MVRLAETSREVGRGMSAALESSDVVSAGSERDHRPAYPAIKVPDPIPSLSRRWRQGTTALRNIASDPRRGTTGAAQLAVSAALVLPAWVALGIAALVVPSSHVETGSHQASWTILSTLAGQLAVGAAVLSLVRAWAAREIAPALAAGGFL